MYQAILEEGAEKARPQAMLEGARALPIRQVSHRFGPPDAPALAKLEAVDSLDKFDDLGQRSYLVSSWKELLGN